MKNAWMCLLDERTRIVLIGSLVLAYELREGVWIGTHKQATPTEVQTLEKRVIGLRVS